MNGSQSSKPELSYSVIGVFQMKEVSKRALWSAARCTRIRAEEIMVGDQGEISFAPSAGAEFVRRAKALHTNELPTRLTTFVPAVMLCSELCRFRLRSHCCGTRWGGGIQSTSRPSGLLRRTAARGVPQIAPQHSHCKLGLTRHNARIRHCDTAQQLATVALGALQLAVGLLFGRSPSNGARHGLGNQMILFE